MRRLPRHLPAARRAAFLRAAVLATAAGGLVGCDPADRFPPACPSLALLPDAADLTRYGGGGQDLTNLVVDARITAIPATCTRDGPGRVRATIRVAMDATRGPAAAAHRVNLPYLVAVMQGSKILDEQDFAIAVEFPPNVDRAQPTGDPVELVVPVTKDRSAAAYRILVGYRLAPAELAINRRRGAR